MFSSRFGIVVEPDWSGFPEALPAADVVEIGYAVSPWRQGRGIADAAVQYFLARAARDGVAMVIAHTLAGVNSSTRVLTKTGFVRTTMQHDPEIGEVWRWERSLQHWPHEWAVGHPVVIIGPGSMSSAGPSDTDC